MTLSIKILIPFIVFLTPAINLFSQTDIKKGLVAYYPFNGTFNDESGNKIHPDLINARLITDRDGKKNSACYFNGKNSFIRIPDNPALHFKKSFSISAWVMVNDFYEGKCHGNRILMKGSTDYLKGNFFLSFDDYYSSKGNNCEADTPDKKKQTFYAPSASPTGPHYIKQENGITSPMFMMEITHVFL